LRLQPFQFQIVNSSYNQSKIKTYCIGKTVGSVVPENDALVNGQSYFMETCKMGNFNTHLKNYHQLLIFI
jgi:hypothetical protein